MRRWKAVVGMVALVLVVATVLAPEARSESAGRTTIEGTGLGEETDFDAVQRDLFTPREEARKPDGWVGRCRPCEEREETRGSDLEEIGDEVSVSPEVIRDQAVPPPDVLLASLPPETDGHLPDPEAPRPGAEHALNMPATIPDVAGSALINSAGRDLDRAEFIDIDSGSVGAFDLDGLQGRFTWSRDDESRPTPILTQYGFATVIELKNGERPTGGAFCGLCGPEGAFHVEALSDRVGIMPREMSSRERGVLATNLTIITDRNRALTFNVVEITSLRDRHGAPLMRTDRHEIRGTPNRGSTVVDWSFEKRVGEASRSIRTQYEAQLDEVKDRSVSEEARSGLESLGDFEVEERIGRRKLSIESVVTIGERTLIKFSVPDGDYSDPVAMIESDGKRKRVRVLQRRSTYTIPGTDEGQDTLVVTLEVAAARLQVGERLAVSIFDKARGEELRASAGKV